MYHLPYLLSIVLLFISNSLIYSTLLSDPLHSSPCWISYTWHIPFTYTTSAFPHTPQLQWMPRNRPIVELSVPNTAWVKGNTDGKGYYRVNYDLKGWTAIIQQLKTNHSVSYFFISFHTVVSTSKDMVEM